jgi:hypothetical protein
MSNHPNDSWDEDKARWLIGKYALVGVTVLKAQSDEVDHQLQIHGTIVAAEKDKGIKIDCRGERVGRIFGLPPNTAIFSPGSDGVYRLRTTGEEINSPDIIASWTVYKDQHSFEENS